jgi:hypothetical protein
MLGLCTEGKGNYKGEMRESLVALRNDRQDRQSNQRGGGEF